MRPSFLPSLVRWQSRLVTGLIAALVGLGVWSSVHRRGAQLPGKPSNPTAIPLAARALPLRVEPTAPPLDLLDRRRVWDAVIRLEQADTKTMSDFLHILRVFGPDAMVRVGGGTLRAGALDLILDSRRNRDFFHGNPTLIDTRDGVRCRTYDRDQGAKQAERQAHDGQLLAVLAELGIPLHRPLSTSGGSWTVGRLLDDMLANFDLKAREIEWVALAIALYLPPRSGWTDKFGRSYTFGDLVNELMSRTLNSERACAGTHLLYSLAVILRADEEAPVLTAPVRAALRSYLEEKRSLALRTQAQDGTWDVRWYEGQGDEAALGPSTDRADRKVLATGHQIEWMLLLPTEMLPSRDCILRAANWLHAKLLSEVQPVVVDHYCPYSHAGRVLLILSRSNEDTPGLALQGQRARVRGL
jgi:hypothetical protein